MMEKVIKEVVNQMESVGESEYVRTPLTQYAVKIAEIALTSFRDELLVKALSIAKAIVDFENEML